MSSVSKLGELFQGVYGPATRVPAIPDTRNAKPSDVLEVVKEWIEVREGARGDGLDRAVTLRDLLNSGLATPFDLTGMRPGQPPPIPLTPGNTDPDIPPTPENLEAVGAFKNVILTCDFARGYSRLAYFEWWRSLTDVIGDAIMVAQTFGTIYADEVGPGKAYYYWVRAVSDAPAQSPFNALAGTLGTTAMDPTEVMKAVLRKLGYGEVDVANGVFPFTTVTELPVLPNPKYPPGVCVLLTTDGKLYRNSTNVWTAAVAASDLTGQVVSSQIADAAVTTAKFAQGIEPVTIVSALPAVAGYTGTKVVFLTTDGKMYRLVAGAWASSVPAGDITGQLVEAQIANAAVTTAKFAQGIEPVSVVTTLPAVAGYTGPKVVLLTADGKLYRLVGGVWTTSLPAGDITGQITGVQITDSAVTAEKIAANAITADKIAANAVTAGKIAADAVTAGTVAAGAINAREIAAGAVTAGKIAADAVTAGTVAAGAINAREIAAGAVTAGKIEANSITAGQIAAGAVSTDELAANAVSADKIAAGAVTADKVAANAITAGKIAAGVVDANAIAANAIVAGKIGTGAIVAGDGVIANAAIGTAHIIDAAITNAKIGNLVVDDAKIANMSVAKLRAGKLAVSEYLESTNYASGDTGFRIHGNGNAEFSNATVRGTIIGRAGYIGNIVMTEASGLYSSNYSATTGFHINHNGQAVFNQAVIRGELVAATGHFRGFITGGSYSSYTWPALGANGFFLGPQGLMMGDVYANRYFQVDNGNVYGPNFSIINGSPYFNGDLIAKTLSTVGGRFIANADGSVVADMVDIRRRIVLQNGALDPTEVVQGWYEYDTGDGFIQLQHAPGAVFHVDLLQIVLTDIYDAATTNPSANQPYYVAGYFNGPNFRNWVGTDGSTFKLALNGQVTSMRTYTNAGNYGDDTRLCIVFSATVELVSGVFDSFRLPTASWTLFKL